MAIKQGGTIVIDDSRNIVNPNAIMMNGEFTPYSGQGPNIAWSAAGKLMNTLTNPNAYPYDSTDDFGCSVAMTDNYIIVGALVEDDMYGFNSGKAYIFNVKTGALLWTLNNPNRYGAATGDYFGQRVAISDKYAAVSTFNSPTYEVYVFDVITGALLRTISNYGGAVIGALNISGNFVVIGVNVFSIITGALIYSLTDPNPYSTDINTQFGRSVAISGNYMLVAAYYQDELTGADSGRAYIYNFTTGALIWTLINPNVYSTVTQDYFGLGIAISGNYAAVGAPAEDDATSITSGRIYIYNVTTGALLFTLTNPNSYGTPENDKFGEILQASGNYLIVGAYYESPTGYSPNAGVVYIYNITTGTLLYTITNPVLQSGVQFGSICTISDNYFAISLSNTVQRAYIYALNTTYRTGKPITSAADFGYVRKSAAGALKWTLNNPNAYSTSAGDLFCRASAISGNYAIVGAIDEDDAGGVSSGKAYIFNVTTGALLFTLNNPNAYSTSEGDNFGYSVAISGNYAIVGANLEDDTGGGTQSGKAYIFNVTTGALLSTLNNPNAYSTSASDQFGNSVAISGNYAIVGAFGEDDAGGGFSGKAYVYNVATGTLLWTLNNPNAYSTSATDYFGSSAAISGNYAIIGAQLEDDAGGTNSGKAYIYNVTTGALLFTLDNPNAYSTSEGDQFGNSVAISGNYAIVGAWQEDDAGGTLSGKAYIFNVTTGALLFTLNNPNVYSTSDSDYFGSSVTISGNYAIVGAPYEDDAGGVSSGKAYIFNVTTGALLFTLNNPNAYSTSDSDYFGYSVAISGNYAIVGAHFEDDAGGTESGKAYIFSVNDVYKLTNVEEIQLANGMKISADNKLLQQSVPGGALLKTLDNPNAYSTSLNDNFGYSVAISGNYAIVGAYFEDDTAGTESGKAYIYNVTTGALLWTLDNPNATIYDRFGYAVAISEKYAIVSSTWATSQSGKVYIYDVTSGKLISTLSNPNAYSDIVTDLFGYSIGISGNYVIASAPAEDDAGGITSGKAYIFNVSTGTLLFTLDNPNPFSTSFNDFFGISVSISGNYAIVGANDEDDAGGSSSGKAYIYNVTTGALLFTLNNPNAFNTSDMDQFGVSVSISGNYAIVGAQSEDDAGGTSSGKAYIYNVTTGTLLLTLNNPNDYSTSAGDQFGYSVAISDNYAIICAIGEDDAAGADSGKAYIYNVTTGALLFTLNNPNAYSTSASDYFGYSVAMSGNYAIVGAYFEDDAGGASSGKAYIFSVRDLTYLDRLVQMVS